MITVLLQDLTPAMSTLQCCDTETGKNTLGFPNTYIDPFTYYARSFAAKTCEIATDPTVKDMGINAGQALAEELSEDYIGKTFAFIFRRVNFFLNIFDPFPDELNEPEIQDRERHKR